MVSVFLWIDGTVSIVMEQLPQQQSIPRCMWFASLLKSDEISTSSVPFSNYVKNCNLALQKANLQKFCS